MRHNAPLLFVLSFLVLPGDAEPLASGRQLALRVAAAESRRDARVAELVSVRRYTLANTRWKAPAVVDVRMITNESGAKRYEIVRATAEGMQRQVITKILDGEVEATRQKREYGAITADNYDLEPVGLQKVNGRPCTSVVLHPKSPSKYTIDGKACIDVADGAVVRLEGRTSKSISFWVGRPSVVQEFKRVGEFWFSARNYSVAEVRLIGTTTLTIDYLDYSIKPRTRQVLMACTAKPCVSTP